MCNRIMGQGEQTVKNHCATTVLEDFVNALWRVIITLDFYKFKLEFGGESPRTSRARCSAFRYYPNPLGIVTAKQLDKLELAYVGSLSVIT